MIYDDMSDGTSGRTYLPLRGRRPVPEEAPEMSSAERAVVLGVMANHPRWGPQEIYAELRFFNQDVPLEVVEWLYEKGGPAGG